MLKSFLKRRKIIGAACLALLGAGFFWAGFEVCWLGKFNFSLRLPEAAAYSISASDSRVAILTSEYSARFFGTIGAYEAHTHYWQELLKKLKLPCDSITDAQLESDLKPFRLLILPSAVCLSGKETANIRSFLKSGNNVICTWATGVRDEKGNWKGWNLLRELTGADRFAPEEGNPPWFVSFLAGSPITAGVPEGMRAQVASPERLEATALVVDGYWSDARLFPADSYRPTNFQGAVLRHQIDRGRVVWYGFQENSAVAGGNDKAIVDAALANGLLWAGRHFLYAVDCWPSCYAAAAVLALETDEDFENAANAVNALLRSQAKGTFFCVPEILRKNHELSRDLKRAGEVAIQGDISTPSNRLGMPAELMDSAASRWKLWRVVGKWPSGFLSPDTPLTSESLRILAGVRCRYYLTGLEAGTVRPAILEVTQSCGGLHRALKLVRLVRASDDDLHFSPLGIVGLEPQWIVQRVLADFDIVSGLGGLYVLAYHTRGLSTPQYAEVLSQLIEQWKSRRTWTTTADEVADWWMKRSQLSVHSSGQGPNSLRLTVVSQAESAIEGAVVSIYPPMDSLHPRVVPVGAQASAPQLILDPSDGRIRLLLGKLEPGKRRSLEVVFEP